MDPGQTELVSPFARRVLIVLWTATIALWALTLVGYAAGGSDAARTIMIGAISVMFFAFVASSVVMMRAGIKSRR
jgi:hypothetical protein